MRDIDKELDAVEKVLAAEDATVGPISKTVIWPIVKRVLAWAVIALALFFVLRAFGNNHKATVVALKAG